jgi:hypothetical protein
MCLQANQKEIPLAMIVSTIASTDGLALRTDSGLDTSGTDDSSIYFAAVH